MPGIPFLLYITEPEILIYTLITPLFSCPNTHRVKDFILELLDMPLPYVPLDSLFKRLSAFLTCWLPDHRAVQD